MFDCSDDVLGYHNDEVTLPQSERTEMRKRRDANRKRLKEGLKRDSKPQPREFCSQGSYAMLTMVQHPNKDYDIDDGVYFLASDLVGPKGGGMTALDARKMVRDAVDDGSFDTPPEVRNNCVRVYYKAGYHVDIPVYRTTVKESVLGNSEFHELASSDWKRSDARDVTEWFEDENTRQSPDDSTGRQLRRITRLPKKFARSRESWIGSIATGFTITKLVTECYKPNGSREDRALYDTMRVIRDRLNLSLEVDHPVTPGEKLTTGPDDAKTKFLRSKLDDAIGWLAVLFESGCTREDALKAWDKVFNTDYFSNRNSPAGSGSGTARKTAASAIIGTDGRSA